MILIILYGTMYIAPYAGSAATDYDAHQCIWLEH